MSLNGKAKPYRTGRRQSRKKMRLDLFLKVSRLCSGRSQAQKLCEAGLVSINGNPAKSAHSVKPEDEIVVRVRNHLLTVRVDRIPTARSVSKAEATSLYTTIFNEELSDGQGRDSL